MFMSICKLLPPRWLKIHDPPSLMLRWPSFSVYETVYVSGQFNHSGSQDIENTQWRTNIYILRSTVAYLHATINSKTRKAELEIGTNRSSKTWQNLWVDRYRPGSSPPRGSRSGFWASRQPNWPIFVVQTRTAGRLPRPIPFTIPIQWHMVSVFRNHMEILLCTQESRELQRCWRLDHLGTLTRPANSTCI